MTQIAHDGAIVVDAHARQRGALTPEEQAYDEARELMKPFDPGMPWADGGRTFTEQVIRHNASIVAEGCVQIGRALIYAKGQMDHGGFRDWLDEQGVSKSSAARMMALATRFASLPALGNLSRTKAVALLGLSDDQLQELNDEGVVETLKRDDIEKLSARELIDTIKKMKKREERGKQQVDALESRIESLEGELNRARGLAPDADDRFLKLIGRFSIDLDEFRTLIRETGDSASATRVWANLLREVRSIRADNLEHIHLGALMAVPATRADEEAEDAIVDELEDAETIEASEGDDDEDASAQGGGA